MDSELNGKLFYSCIEVDLATVGVHAVSYRHYAILDVFKG
jgi:hypothetical protein